MNEQVEDNNDFVDRFQYRKQFDVKHFFITSSFFDFSYFYFIYVLLTADDNNDNNLREPIYTILIANRNKIHGWESCATRIQAQRREQRRGVQS